MKFIKGRTYRVTETYVSGTSVVTTGKVAADCDPGLSNYVRIEAGETTTVTCYSTSFDHVTVTVEEISGPLPKTWGSVIRYYYMGRDHPNNFQVQMRVAPEAMVWPDDAGPAPMGHWRTADGGLVADPVGNAAWDLIFDPDHPKD